MAKHMVKCPICNKMFDANQEPYVMISSRRYAHLSCQQSAQEQAEQIQKDKEALEQYIKQLFNYKTLPEKVNRQIKQYVTERNYTYSGILKTLKYWFEIKQGDIEKANGGIGIVPFIYDDAFTYWRGVWEIKERNKEAEQIIIPVREVHITSPKRTPMRRFRKQFTFLEDEDGK